MDKIEARKNLLETIEHIENKETLDDTVGVFQSYIEQFGFSTIALGHLINPLSDLASQSNFQVTNWPIEWYDQWRMQDFIIHDPIARYALRIKQPFKWSKAYEHGSRFGKTILDESRNFGMKDGLAIPITTPDGPPGCVSLGTEFNVDLSPEELSYIEMVSIHLYARLEQMCGATNRHPMKSLSRREIDVLQYAAAGKSTWEIAQILSIAERTARDYLASSMKKLNCDNRSHAVATAIRESLILP